jgi:purine-binding chemotaxis protein CheW
MSTLQLADSGSIVPTLSVDRSLHFPAQEILAFRLAEEEYGIPLRCVQEIRSYQTPTRLAGAHAQWLGVIDLRGEVVPLLDLRRRLALAAAEPDSLTVIVISLGERRIGVLADQVNDVIALERGQIGALPALPGVPEQRYMPGIAVVADRRLVLMDIQGLLREEAAPTVPEADALAA